MTIQILLDYKELLNQTEKLVSLITMLLLAISLSRALLTIGHFLLISSFVSSRPPGRKMVGIRYFPSVKVLNFEISIFISTFGI